MSPCTGPCAVTTVGIPAHADQRAGEGVVVDHVDGGRPAVRGAGRRSLGQCPAHQSGRRRRDRSAERGGPVLSRAEQGDVDAAVDQGVRRRAPTPRRRRRGRESRPRWCDQRDAQRSAGILRLGGLDRVDGRGPTWGPVPSPAGAGMPRPPTQSPPIRSPRASSGLDRLVTAPTRCRDVDGGASPREVTSTRRAPARRVEPSPGAGSGGHRSPGSRLGTRSGAPYTRRTTPRPAGTESPPRCPPGRTRSPAHRLRCRRRDPPSPRTHPAVRPGGDLHDGRATRPDASRSWPPTASSGGARSTARRALRGGRPHRAVVDPRRRDRRAAVDLDRPARSRSTVRSATPRWTTTTPCSCPGAR